MLPWDHAAGITGNRERPRRAPGPGLERSKRGLRVWHTTWIGLNRARETGYKLREDKKMQTFAMTIFRRRLLLLTVLSFAALC